MTFYLAGLAIVVDPLFEKPRQELLEGPTKEVLLAPELCGL